MDPQLRADMRQARILWLLGTGQSGPLTDAVFDAVIEEFDALFRAMYDDLLWNELYGWMAQMFRWEADLRHRRWTQRPWRTDDLQRAAFAYEAACDQFRMPPPPEPTPYLYLFLPQSACWACPVKTLTEDDLNPATTVFFNTTI
jgi:hypothetical protein